MCKFRVQPPPLLSATRFEVRQTRAFDSSFASPPRYDTARISAELRTCHVACVAQGLLRCASLLKLRPGAFLERDVRAVSLFKQKVT